MYDMCDLLFSKFTISFYKCRIFKTAWLDLEIADIKYVVPFSVVFSGTTPLENINQYRIAFKAIN